MFKFIKLYYLVPKFFLPIAPTCSNPFKVTSPNLLTLSGISRRSRTALDAALVNAMAHRDY